MAREISSWLSGPEPFDSAAGAPGQDRGDYPGHRLGLPQHGSGSIAGFGANGYVLALEAAAAL